MGAGRLRWRSCLWSWSTGEGTGTTVELLGVVMPSERMTWVAGGERGIHRHRAGKVGEEQGCWLPLPDSGAPGEARSAAAAVGKWVVRGRRFAWNRVGWRRWSRRSPGRRFAGSSGDAERVAERSRRWGNAGELVAARDSRLRELRWEEPSLSGDTERGNSVSGSC
ncbi:hypothetical protein MLD38_026245 [Melastoma candidum]|uniref:Uncharacterized protein n=1 Tax=Melastoma candidum TaxID=119954 RepID=A0ACB9NXZ2_9MYRT|nr:hypothetical protein MLD38_026245 [Melastoma candidum]